LKLSLLCVIASNEALPIEKCPKATARMLVLQLDIYRIGAVKYHLGQIFLFLCRKQGTVPKVKSL
jgi:hypothetical protein